MRFIVRCFYPRMWYVNNFLIPSLERQNIHPDVIMDDGRMGNLRGFVYTMDYIARLYPPNDATWVLQDDVLISSRFADVARSVNKDVLTCAFASKLGDGDRVKFTGFQPMRRSWMSFQAIMIPNRYCAPFVEWFDTVVKKGDFFRKYYESNKADDFFFQRFLWEKYPNDKVLNLCPNIVEHVDGIIGDSYCNPQKIGRNVSKYWFENDLKNKLKEDVGRWKNENGASRG